MKNRKTEDKKTRQGSNAPASFSLPPIVVGAIDPLRQGKIQ